MNSVINTLASPLENDSVPTTGKGKKKKTSVDVDDPAADWRESGSARKEWLERAAYVDILTCYEFLTHGT